ncbi:MAG: VOC family protein [Pyrinomonadaceae bacterium]
MSEVALTEQLDQAIEAMLRSPDAKLPVAAPQVAEMLSIAAELRDLPRADFRERLKGELEREMTMSAAAGESAEKPGKVNPIREGFRTVTPYVVVQDVHAEIDFVKNVFDAEGQVHGLGSQGGFHAEYRIGDSMLMIGGGGKGSEWRGTPVPAALHLYVEDVDAVYDRAVRAGATSTHAPIDQPYGDREAGVKDASGNSWYIATHKGARYLPEGATDLMPYLHPTGAPKMIEFLKQAFGAEEMAVHQSPDGVIHHATVRIGTSVLEMGEAHGQWQPMPMHFMLYVDDVDAWYARATKAEGAISMGEPRDQPYGARVGTVKDPFDNVWYLATQIGVKEQNSTEPERSAMTGPKLFRVTLQVSDLDKAATFYSTLLDDEGRRIPRGARHYFDCGPMILALVDVGAGGMEAKPIPDYIYFAVGNLEEMYERARALNCLAKEKFHDQNAGEIVKRPWGELSFYVEDPWGNGLCFVDEGTLFTGR